MHLTPRQLAARWQVSEKTLERWRHEGNGPAFLKVVGRVLYPVQHIEAMEAERIRLTSPNSLAPDNDRGAINQGTAGTRRHA